MCAFLSLRNSGKTRSQQARGTLEGSLAWPDHFRAAAYRLEIISAALQKSGIVHEHEIFRHVVDDD